MTLDQETRGDVLILRPVGRLDSVSSPELERLVLDKLGSGSRRLVMDLTGMEYVSSAGLRVLLLAAKSLRASQGKLVLVGMQDMVRDVFQMSGFLKLFEVAATLDEGLTKV